MEPIPSEHSASLCSATTITLGLQQYIKNARLLGNRGQAEEKKELLKQNRSFQCMTQLI